MTQTNTNRYKKLLASGGIVPGTTSIKMGLLGTSAFTDHASVPDCHFVSDLLALASAHELTGVSGYARTALASMTATEDDTNNWALIDSADVAFGSLGTGDTIYAAFIFIEEGGADSARELLAVFDLTSTPTNGGTVTITTPNGITKLT